ELYLKRLLVGGFNKVFEISRNFRNEGISRKHNPEFTMLEAYWAYADWEKMANLVEELICYLAEKICGSLTVEHRDSEEKIIRTINLKRPWRRARYRDVLREVAGKDWFELSPEQRRDRATNEFKLEILPQLADFEVTQHVFEKLVEEKTIDPLFVTHSPKELVPLAKQNTADDSLVDVFELIINGAEIAPGYSELNDPLVQRQRLIEQAGEERQKIDEDFLLALEHGMPPAGGIGIGMDRLTMLLTGAESIRDVILFPLLRPKKLYPSLSERRDFERRLVTYRCSVRCPQRRASAFARRTGDRRSLFYDWHVPRIVSLLFLIVCSSAAAVIPAKPEHRIVVVVWDGMRPDFVTEQNTPTLWKLARE